VHKFFVQQLSCPASFIVFLVLGVFLNNTIVKKM
jgi:hypothetical protein